MSLEGIMWDLNTAKKWMEGEDLVDYKIVMMDLEALSSSLPSNIPGRYLMMRNVILCGKKNRDGEDREICKNKDDQLKLHIMKGSSIELIFLAGNTQCLPKDVSNIAKYSFTHSHGRLATTPNNAPAKSNVGYTFTYININNNFDFVSLMTPCLPPPIALFLGFSFCILLYILLYCS